MTEFFVARGLRRKGVGGAAAAAVFRSLPGAWEVRALDRNSGAGAFWARTIAGHTGGAFEAAASPGVEAGAQVDGVPVRPAAERPRPTGRRARSSIAPVAGAPMMPVMKGTLLSLVLLTGVAAPLLAADSPHLRPSEETAKERLNTLPRHGEFGSVDVAGTSVRVWTVYPQRSDKAPVVIVIQETFGATDWDPQRRLPAGCGRLHRGRARSALREGTQRWRHRRVPQPR